MSDQDPAESGRTSRNGQHVLQPITIHMEKHRVREDSVVRAAEVLLIEVEDSGAVAGSHQGFDESPSSVGAVDEETRFL